MIVAIAVGCTRETTPPPAGTDTPTPTMETTAPTSTPTDEPAPLDVPVALALHPTIGSIVIATWSQPVAANAHVELMVDEGVWRTTPDREVAAGPQEQLLLGIPYDTPVDVRVAWDEGQVGSVSSITTGLMPGGFPTPTLASSDPTAYWADGTYLLGSINQDEGGWTDGRYWMFVADRLGRIVWVYRGIDRDFTIYLHVSTAGEILWDQSTFWSEFDGGMGSKIHRMTIDGTEIETMDAPGMHHCFIEMPDGSIVWGAADGFDSERVMRLWPDDTVTTIWDCAPFYDSLGLNDWCHTNSIVYDESTDRLLLSFPTEETFVLEVDATTGDEIRWFGHIPGSWAFDSPTSAFQYQHGVTWTDEGTLLMSSQLSPTNVDALVREYTLDEGTETLTQIWSFGADDDIDAVNAGEAHRLPNGNTLHNTGTTPRVREITADDQVVWDLVWPGNRLLGRTVFVNDLYTLLP